MSLGRLFAVTAFSLLFLISRFASADEAQATLVWRGCGVSKKAFMEECAAAYQKQTGVTIRLSGGGATLGIESAASGGADLGGTCRACLASRNEDKLPVKLAVVAWDALTVIVHKENKVTGVSREQLRAVLNQEITDWKALGGSDERIIVVVRRGKTSGVGYSVRQIVLEDGDANFGSKVLRLNSSGPLEEFVERQPRAIAVTGYSSAQKRDVKVLGIDGHPPSPATIASGEYPYYRPLYIAYHPGRNPVADRFVEWLLSDAGQKVIEDQQTVSLRQGAKLTKTYGHFGDTKQIINYASLVQLAAQADQ